jgi:hypothetical protein
MAAMLRYRGMWTGQRPGVEAEIDRVQVSEQLADVQRIVELQRDRRPQRHVRYCPESRKVGDEILPLAWISNVVVVLAVPVDAD